jgi:hypothetical protein
MVWKGPQTQQVQLAGPEMVIVSSSIPVIVAVAVWVRGAVGVLGAVRGFGVPWLLAGQLGRGPLAGLPQWSVPVTAALAGGR